MRLPRDITGRDLARRLSRLGYEITRQTGSHIRLTTTREGQHHITVPDHSPLRTGTLAAILGDISLHFKTDKKELIETIFGS